MGAYENPETFIDTQSGQHIRNLIGNVSDSSAAFIKQLAEKQKLEREKINKFETDLAYKSDNLLDAVDAPASMDLDSFGNEMKSYLGKYSTDALSSDPAKSRNANNLISTAQRKFKNTLSGAVEHVATFSENRLKALEKGIGVQGGFYSGTPSDDLDTTYAFKYGKGLKITPKISKKGDTGEIDPDDADIEISATLPDGKPFKKVMKLSAIRNNNEQRLDGNNIIPSDEKSRTKANMTSVFNVTEANGKKSVGEGLNATLIGDEKYGTIESKEIGKKVMSQTGKLMQSGFYQVYKVDIDKLSAHPDVVSQSRSYVDGMIQTDKKGLAMLYNDILLKKNPNLKPIKDINNAQEITDRVGDITSAYAKHIVADHFTNNEIIMKDVNGDEIVTQTKYVKPTSTNPTGSSGNLTPAQRKAEAAKKLKLANKLKAIDKTVKDGVRTNANLPKGFTYNKTTKNFSFISDSGKGSSYTAEELKAAVEKGEF
jgi:hypothetical protein